MGALTRRLTAAVVFVLASLSVWAEADQPGELLIAPQLAVASDGPITATFLGASQPFNNVFAFGETPFFDDILFGPQATPGRQSQTSALSAGTDVTLGTVFGIFFDPSTPPDQVISATASSNPDLIADLTGAEAVGFNAGVIRTGQDRVLVGFNSPGLGQPSGFGGFAVRIAVSNVCVR